MQPGFNPFAWDRRLVARNLNLALVEATLRLALGLTRRSSYGLVARLGDSLAVLRIWISYTTRASLETAVSSWCSSAEIVRS